MLSQGRHQFTGNIILSSTTTAEQAAPAVDSPLIPPGLPHPAYESYMQKRTLSVYQTQYLTSHTLQGKRSSLGPMSNHRKWKSGFRLWLFIGVCVSQALPRNMPRFFLCIDITLQHCTLKEQKSISKMDKKSSEYHVEEH